VADACARDIFRASEIWEPEARCIKERSSDLRHSYGALLNATPAPAGALQVFLDHKKTSLIKNI